MCCCHLLALLSWVSSNSAFDGSPFQQRLHEKLSTAYMGPSGFLNRTVENQLIAPGFWFAFHNGSESFTIALGSRDGKIHGLPATGSDIMPIGSLTKPFTAAAVMRLVEAGVVNLEDSITPHVDPFLHRANGTTLGQLWGPKIHNVSIRMLLNMRSGLTDYDNIIIRRLTNLYPDYDISPFDYLHMNSKAWLCDPGNCSKYCSINYLLLALLLNNHLGPVDATDWKQVDQRAAAIPTTLLLPLPPPNASSADQNASAPGGGSGYQSTQFFKRGRCSAYGPRVAHYFEDAGTKTTNGTGGGGPRTYHAFTDMYGKSCVNGYGFGNLGVSVGDLAAFFWDLLGPVPRIVSGRSRLLMQQFTGWGTTGDYCGDKHHYGLGLWTDAVLELPCRQIKGKCAAQVNTSIPGIWPYVQYVGHGGADYGTYFTAGYHPELRFAFAMGTNQDINDGRQNNDVMCLTWQALWELLGLPGGAAAFVCGL